MAGKGTALIVGALGVGAVILVMRRASAVTSDSNEKVSPAASTPKTEVEKIAEKLKAKAASVSKPSATVTKAKEYVKKGAAEVEALRKLLT